MTLSTGNIGTEKSGQRVRKTIQWHTSITQKISSGSILSEPSFCRQHIVNHFVPWTIFVKLCLQPSVKRPGFTNAVVVILHTKHVSQPVKHVRFVSGRLQQLINQLGSTVFTAVGEKTSKFVISRNSTDHIQIHSADELNITDRRIRL